MIYNINAAINILAAGLVLYSSIVLYRSHLLPLYLTILFWIVCLGWMGLYVFVLLADPLNVNSVQIGRVFIRPLITLTLGTMAATFVYRSRRRRIP